MKRDEFLERLSKTPRTWRVTKQGLIRDGAGKCVVIGCLEPSHPMKISGAISIAERHGLDLEVARDVIRCADQMKDFDPHFRNELLRACGLA